jgi:hypothetical protein
MSNLTGQAIQNTYPGLLNLATATTGVTSTPQQIQDGLGNNTGTKIATNWLTNPMVLGLQEFKGDYYGLGFSNTAVAPVASSQNVIIAVPFYDSGSYDYSAITYNVLTATSSSDVVTVGFYTTQFVDGVGLAPSVLIQSGITISSAAPLGVKTTTLPSTLSFSAYGPGIYFHVMKISNGGVTPTVRYGGAVQNTNYAAISTLKNGYVLTTAGTAAQNPYKSPAGQACIVYSGLTNFQTSYSAADVRTFSSTVAFNQPYGFVVNTIK